MPARIGIDLVEVEEVREALAAHGERYLRRVFTDAEVDDCRRPDGTVDARRLAARFAAKEATGKALRTGDRPLPWTDVEVVRDPHGTPALALHGTAAVLAAEQGLEDFAVTMTHARDQAAAVVHARPGP